MNPNMSDTVFKGYKRLMRYSVYGIVTVVSHLAQFKLMEFTNKKKGKIKIYFVLKPLIF